MLSRHELKLRLRKPILIHTGRSHKGNSKKTVAFILTLVLLVTALLGLRNLQPILTEMATATSRDIVTQAINDAINRRLSDGTLSYDSLITLEKDDSGAITALTTDMAKINTLQAEITNEVIDAVSEMGSARLRVPLGNIIGGSWLSGRGPGIPFKVVSLATSSAKFENAFESAGINQTKHKILIDVTVDVSILMPGKTTKTQVQSQVLVAETVIVGDVPNSYVNLQ